MKNIWDEEIEDNEIDEIEDDYPENYGLSINKQYTFESLSEKWLKNSFNKDYLDPRSILTIINSIRKIINIVHGGEKYLIIFKGQKSDNYTRYDKKMIVLSTQLVRNKPDNYSINDVIDILTGVALHESGHAEESDKYASYKIKTNLQFKIYNIIEDVIIEMIIAMKYPGFESYFLKTRKHYFNLTKNSNKIDENIDEIEENYDETNKNVVNIFNDILYALRTVEDYSIKFDCVEEAYNYITHKINQCKTLEDLQNLDRIKMSEIAYGLLYKDFLKNNIVLPSNVSNIFGDEIIIKNNENGNTIKININNNEIENNENENDEVEDNEIENDEVEDNEVENDETENDETENDFNEIIDGLNNVFQNKDFNNLKSPEDEDDKLNDVESDELFDLEEEGYEEIINKYDDCNNSAGFGKTHKEIVAIRKPKSFNNSYDIYKSRLAVVRPYISRFKTKFMYANTPYKVNCYGLQSGNLDDDSLFESKYNKNIFMNTQITKTRTKNIDLAFCIDCSSSMGEKIGKDPNGRTISRITASKDLAILFIEALESIRSIQTWVYGFMNSQVSHSNSYNRNRLTTELLEVYNPKSKKKDRITTLYSSGNTPEYEALCGVVEQLKKEGRKDSKKVIIMLTDGEPGSSCYPQYTQMSLIKEKLKEMEKQNFTVIHLGMTADAQLNTSYKHVVKYSPKGGYKKLIEQFSKTLENVIK